MKNHVVTLDLTEVEMDEDRVTEEGEEAGGIDLEPVPARKFLELYANLVVDALNTVDHAVATRDQRRKYIHHVDPVLAMRFPFDTTKKPSGPLMRNTRYLRAFEAAERRGLAKIRKDQVARIYRGPFGENMRDLFVAEWEQAEKMRSNLSSQYTNTFMGILAVGLSWAASGLAVSNPNSNIYLSLRQSSAQLNQTAVVSLVSGTQLDGARSNLSQTFESSLEDIREERMNFQIRLEGEELIDVEAEDLTKARGKFRTVYAKRTGTTHSSAQNGSDPQWYLCGKTERPMIGSPGNNLKVLWLELATISLLKGTELLDGVCKTLRFLASTKARCARIKRTGRDA